MELQSVWEIFARQHGIATRGQLLDVWTPKRLRLALDRGEICVVHRGVYRSAAAPETWEQQLYAAVAGTPRTFASHRSAARLLGFLPFHTQQVEITVPYGASDTRENVRVHRSRVPDEAPVVIDGIATTGVARTVVDLSAVLGRERLERTLDEGLRRQQIDVAEVQACLDVIGRYGRRNVHVLEKLLAERGEIDRLMESEWEAVVLKWMRGAGLPDPVAQFPVLLRGKRCRVDFAYPDLKLAIEVDGKQHELPWQRRRDELRDADLLEQSWETVRIKAGFDRQQALGMITAARSRAFTKPDRGAADAQSG